MGRKTAFLLVTSFYLVLSCSLQKGTGYISDKGAFLIVEHKSSPEIFLPQNKINSH